MHACLNTDEIVRLIACELVASTSKATAVALACSHKAFQDPVLDALWEIQEKLLPLFETLPGDVWNNGECTRFKKFPTAREWARFRRYARRMRHLEQPEPLDGMSLEVLSALQPSAINELLFPNLKTLKLWLVTIKFIPFIPLFLSPRITTINIAFSTSSYLPPSMVTSIVTALPTLCPNLQHIDLKFLPKDPMIATSVSGMFLTSDLDGLRSLKVDSPLAKDVHQVIRRLPNLRELSVVIEGDTILPPLVLPNLADLTIQYDRDSAWLQIFSGATFGNLESVTFHPTSEIIGDFLEVFEKIALATSAQNTLSQFSLLTSFPWKPNYSSLLRFTQLTSLTIGFSCDGGCTSTVDDNIVMDLARAMPKLNALHLGEAPCDEIPIGVTTEGLAALSRYCPDLSALRVHFQVASLCALPVNYRVASDPGSVAPQRVCALTDLDVGEIPVPDDSVLMVALNLSLIFPRINNIEFDGENWERVADAIFLSRAIVNYSRTAPENLS